MIIFLTTCYVNGIRERDLIILYKHNILLQLNILFGIIEQYTKDHRHK